MSIYKNPLFYFSVMLAIIVGFQAITLVQAVFTEPSTAFPGGTPSAPLVEGPVSQVKTEELKFASSTTPSAIEAKIGYLGICLTKVSAGGFRCASTWELLASHAGLSGATWSFEGGGPNIFYDDGNVGIGTNTPAGVFHVATGTITNAFVVASDGNVGIGTAGPSEKLDVVGNIEVDGMALNTTYRSGSYEQSIYGSMAGGGETELTGSGWSMVQAMLFNAYKKSSQVDGSLWATGNTAYTRAMGGTYGLRAGSFGFGGNGGNFNWLVSPASGAADADVTFTNIMNLSSAGNLQMDGILSVDGTGDSYIMGNVGIGTVTPQNKLSVVGSIGLLRESGDDIPSGPGPALTIQSPSDEVSTMYGPSWTACGGAQPSCGTDNTPDHDLDISYSCPAGSGGNSYSNDVSKLGGLTTQRYKNSVDCIAGTASYTLRTNAGTLEFLNSGGVTKMVIDQDGRVGIGTSGEPATQLHIAGDDPDIFLDINADSPLDWTELRFGSGGVTKSNIYWSKSDDKLYIKNVSGDVGTIVIDSSGNVGIGTASPGSYRLKVSGTTNITGDTTIGGIIYAGSSIMLSDVNKYARLITAAEHGIALFADSGGDFDDASSVAFVVLSNKGSFNAPYIRSFQVMQDGDVRVYKDLRVDGDVRVIEDLRVDGDVRVIEDLRVDGDVQVDGDLTVGHEIVESGWKTGLSGGGSIDATASCSAGKMIMGGGCNTNTDEMKESYPSSDSQWYCQAYNPAYAAKVQAYAICANIK